MIFANKLVRRKTIRDLHVSEVLLVTNDVTGYVIKDFTCYGTKDITTDKSIQLSSQSQDLPSLIRLLARQLL